MRRRDRAHRPASPNRDGLQLRVERGEGVRASCVRLRSSSSRRPAVAWKMLESMADRLALAESRWATPWVALGEASLAPTGGPTSSELFEVGYCARSVALSRLTVSVPAAGSTTRPPNTTQRTPASPPSPRRRRVPSPRGAPGPRRSRRGRHPTRSSSNPLRSRTAGAPSTSRAPSAAPAPGSRTARSPPWKRASARARAPRAGAAPF